jgi:hypothetical protein
MQGQVAKDKEMWGISSIQIVNAIRGSVAHVNLDGKMQFSIFDTNIHLNETLCWGLLEGQYQPKG